MHKRKAQENKGRERETESKREKKRNSDRKKKEIKYFMASQHEKGNPLQEVQADPR